MVELFSAAGARNGGPTLAVLWDSFAGNDEVVTAISIDQLLTSCCTTMFRLVSGGRFYFPTANNLGVSGNTSSQMLARLSSLLALNPDVAIIPLTGNDPGTVILATAKTNYKTMWDACRARGIKVLAATIPPRDSPNAFSPNNALECDALNNWAREQARNRKDFFLADLDRIIADPSGATWAIRSGYLRADGVHPSPTGAYVWAQQFLPVLNAWFPPWYQTCANPGGSYDGTHNPYGNLLPNGSFQGTAGVIDTPGAGSGVTGTVATNWNAAPSTNVGGATIVYAKDTMSDGRPCQKITVSGSKTGNTKFLYLYSPLGNLSSLAAGDAIENGLEVEIDSPTNIISTECWLQTTEIGTTYYHRIGRGAATDPIPSTGYTVPLLTPRRTLLAQPSSAYIWFQAGFVDGSVSVAAMIKVASAFSRRIDPN